MRKLALDVADAGQLCEAISSALRQHVAPGPAAQACLEAALAAAEAIPAFPEPGRTFSGGLLPAQLLQQLAAIVVGWGVSAPEARQAAAALLVAVLPACGEGVRDEKQALGLLTLVRQMAQNSALGTPQDVAAMDRLLQVGARAGGVCVGRGGGACAHAAAQCGCGCGSRAAVHGAACRMQRCYNACRLWHVACRMWKGSLAACVRACA